MATSIIKSNAWTYIGASGGETNITLPTDFSELIVDLFQNGIAYNTRTADSITIPKVRFVESPTGDSDRGGLALLWEGQNLRFVVYKMSETTLGVHKVGTSSDFSVRVYAR